jgi:hypothetical protein
MAHRCLQNYAGSWLIYIGEDENGCTGDDQFFNELSERWELKKSHRIAQWDGIHDLIFVYERREVD